MSTFGAALRRKYLEIGQHEPLRLRYIDGGWKAVRAAMMESFYGRGDLFQLLTERMVMIDGGWEAFCREMFPGSLPPDPNPDYNISGPFPRVGPPEPAADWSSAPLHGLVADLVLSVHLPKEEEERDTKIITLKERAPTPTRGEMQRHNFELLYGAARPLPDRDPDPTT